jgi:hypothetical protein
VNRYHRVVQDGIVLHGQHRRYPKVFRDNRPIHINHPTTKRQILYRPDAIFETKFGKKILFEVLDDQLHDDNLIIADIIQAYVSENVSRIVFVVPTEADQDKVRDLALTIYSRLVDMGISKRTLRSIGVMYILRSEASTKERVAELVSEMLSRQAGSKRSGA